MPRMPTALAPSTSRFWFTASPSPGRSAAGCSAGAKAVIRRKWVGFDLLGTFTPSGQTSTTEVGVRVFASLLHVTVPTFAVMVMKPDVAPPGSVMAIFGLETALPRY